MHRKLWEPRTIIVVGLALGLPSVGTGLVLDDLPQQQRAREVIAGRGESFAALDLFTFASGHPEDNRRRMDEGQLLPWWSDPELKVSFVRPLSSLTHVVDAALWGESPALMHAHTLVWYGLLLGAVWALYARLHDSRRIAILALALYAVDDTHGATLAWLANRNAVLTTLLGVATLWTHHRALASRGRRALVAPMVFGVALLAGEAAIATLGYLAAHALFLDRRSWRRRLLSLTPFLAVAAAWQVAYRALGHGAAHSGVYHDPAQGWAFIQELGRNAVVLLASQIGGFPADLVAWGPRAWSMPLWAAGALGLALIGWLSWPLLRARAVARFWVTGAMLAVVPISASIPGDRLLLFVGVGAMGFFAELFAWQLGSHAAARSRRADSAFPGPSRRLGTAGVMMACLVACLVLRRTVAAGALLPLRAQAVAVVAAPANAAHAAVRSFGERATEVIFVDAPISAAVGYLTSRWALEGVVQVPRVRWLAEGRVALTVTRPEDNVLRVAPLGGFLQSNTERLYRADDRPLRRGETVALTGMTATVVSLTSDGRPAAVDFRFPGPLESPGRLWLTWHGSGYQRFTPPARGELVVLPPATLTALSEAHVIPDEARAGGAFAEGAPR